MALNDVFSLEMVFETPTGVAKSKLYYRESATNLTVWPPTKDIAQAFLTAMTAVIRGMLSDDYWFAGVICRQVHPTQTVNALKAPFLPYQRAESPAAYYTTDGPGQAGLRSGPGLPANNAVQLDLVQSTFGLRSNGSLFIPGIPEVDTTGGTLTAGYLAACASMAAILEVPLASATDAGVWDPVVVSAKVRDVLGPGQPKDWITSIALIQSIDVNPIISVRRSRTTRVSVGTR